MESQKRPAVGVGVIVCRGSHVLVGERRASLGSGKHALPGGHLELGETFEACAAREVKEETGLELQNITYVHTLNSIFENVHYVTVFMRGTVPEGAEAVNLEPSKCVAWKWVPWDSIPSPMFEPLLQLQRTGYHPFPTQNSDPEVLL
eukprot:jgi/Botrbrau1/757/Bobra.0181s0016.1